jgi:hypothetical protein
MTSEALYDLKAAVRWWEGFQQVKSQGFIY